MIVRPKQWVHVPLEHHFSLRSFLQSTEVEKQLVGSCVYSFCRSDLLPTRRENKHWGMCIWRIPFILYGEQPAMLIPETSFSVLLISKLISPPTPPPPPPSAVTMKTVVSKRTPSTTLSAEEGSDLKV